MSFKCENCNESQENGTKEIKVVTQRRSVIYPAIKDDRGSVKKIPTGFETVRELSICPTCSKLDYDVLTVDEKVLV